MNVSLMTISKFRALVWKHYREQGRHTLPWRTTHDPYRILVSEVMLQQTQVDRVIPYYCAWLRDYPTVRSLAKASLATVLVSWQGLGYNRRAKMLHDAAKTVVREHAGTMPKSVEALELLPGVGAYTARAIAAFAYNQKVVFVETNLRTAVIHHFYSDRTDVSDHEVQTILAQAFPKDGTSREWYAALMDYGAYLKRRGIRINAKSKGYTKQSKFNGSTRQVRGALLKKLSEGLASGAALLRLFAPERSHEITIQLEKLTKEGLIKKTGRNYHLPF